MTYETATILTDVITLVAISALLIGLIVYLLWPSSRARLETAQRRALELDSNS